MPSRKFFLGIGINYTGTSNELNGCINDVNNTEKFFRKKFPDLQSTFLTDTTVKKPTRDTILTELKRLLSLCASGDTFILHFSGHGTSIQDQDNDEKDKKDECIVPLDLKVITDDELQTLLVAYVKPNVFVFGLLDSCFSGTVLDLPYTYFSSSIPLKKNNKKIQPKGKVIMISGCRDDQTSADAYLNNSFNGAMTWAFLNSYPSSSDWIGLVEKMRIQLKDKKFSQIPLLSFNGNINVPLL
jgi:hypothetical protein